VGAELAPPALRSSGGSAIVVLATDAPLSSASLARLARRAFLALGRTGSTLANGSGEYALAFSVHPDVRRAAGSSEPVPRLELGNAALSPLFQAAVEATEEAVYNALLRATTVESALGRLDAIPLEPLASVLARRGLGPAARGGPYA
jgi:D-aminopeptidase